MQAKSVVDDEVVASYKQACTQATVPHSGNSIKSQTICKITIDDIAKKVRYFENVVVCFVVGVNPPLHVIDGFIKRI